MSRRNEALTFLRQWNPEAEELPEWIAEQLDDDAGIRDAFDERFTPWDANDLGAAPAETPVKPSRKSRRTVIVGASLLAAAAVLAVLLPASSFVFAPQSDTVQRAYPESIALNLDDGIDAAPPPPPDMAEALSHMGYVDTVPPSNAPRARRGPPVQRRPARITRPATDQPPQVRLAPGFVPTNEDARSTFSVDVDTASFTLARQALRAGRWPSADTVRPEEFLNYVPYRYPNPTGDDAFAVHVEGAGSPFDDTELVRIGLQGRRANGGPRKPVHLTFLVDTSGSMQSPQKMGYARYALTELTTHLEEGDTIAMVAYAGSAGVILPPTPLTQRARILEAIARMQAGGSTAMGQGIRLAYTLADETYVPGAVNRVVLLSDGDANVGITNPDHLVSLIRQYADRGITLTTVGFGQGPYRDDMMEKLANKGDGNYVFIDSEREARRVFVDQLPATLEVIARDVKIQVEWNPKVVESYRLVGYDNRRIADHDFRNDRVDAGEIGMGHQVTALYRVVRTPFGREADRSTHLATVYLREKPPGPDRPARERSIEVPISVIRSRLAGASPDLRLAVGAAWFAEMLRGTTNEGSATYRDLQKLVAGSMDDTNPEHQALFEVIGLARQRR
ncbi:MAG: von Willebrand factor type A domain-containing protein [Myxococcota bacterium]